jgi:hypothetical protein
MIVGTRDGGRETRREGQEARGRLRCDKWEIWCKPMYKGVFLHCSFAQLGVDGMEMGCFKEG